MVETAEERRDRARSEEQAALEQAERLTTNLPRQGDPTSPLLTPAEAAQPGEAMVPMLFAHPAMLTLADYRIVRFPAGFVDVPASMADDPYLAVQGAKRR